MEFRQINCYTVWAWRCSAASKRKIKLADLAGCEWIHLAPSTSVRQHVDQLTRGIAVHHAGLEVEHLATLAGLIGHGLGVRLMPELTLFQFRRWTWWRFRSIPMPRRGRS